MTRPLTCALLIVVATSVLAAGSRQASATRAPLDIAKVLAAKYPAQPIMSYIPGLGER